MGVMDEELAREAARYWASLRRRAQGVCVWCGKPFEGTVRRRYCSHQCVQKAYYQRRHDEILQRQRARRKKKRQEGQP